jgi:hypothetical protein
LGDSADTIEEETLSCEWHKRVRWLQICRKNRKVRQMYIEGLQEAAEIYRRAGDLEEDLRLKCPADVKTATGHFDPSGIGSDPCAGCGVPRKDHVLDEESCWLCGGDEADTTTSTERETPGGKSCAPMDVKVHFECYMDMDP